MQYYDLESEEDITLVLGAIRQTHGSLSQFVVGSERESTMGGKSILTLFLRFDPTVKIEGQPELVDSFVAAFSEQTAR